MKKKRRTMKKKRNSQYKNTIFPLLLAALCSESHNRRALIKKCLKKLFLSLPHVDLSPILSLLPSLLKFNCADIVCRSAEIIGAASLASFDMNEKIVLEDEIVKGLISLLRSSKREISMAACNAVLDLATTSVGRQSLLEFSAIENFILCFIQEPKSPALTVSHASDMTLVEENEYTKLLLQGAITLINSCTIEQLNSIPMELSGKFIVYLKGIWRQAHKQRLCSTSSNRNILAEGIFRLSITHDLHQELIDIEQIKKNIFDSGELSMEHFLSESWEISPVLMKAASKTSLGQNGNFSPFFQFLDLKEGIAAFLHSLLKNIISCPAIASDDLDILNIINDIKGHFGYPIMYNQDIRVVKTWSEEKELHYFDDHHIFDINDILQCGEAFKEGYTIALRGMEFRYKILADIADGLASLFGQPSSGINMYLTPLSSQGLAKHSDDHCVFVCQLIGVKKWKIFYRRDLCLPRLYENCDELCGLEGGVDGCQEFVVKEGDVLYIPRGFPHEARTDVYDDENVETGDGFSLHLTLAVEIEPPFEWEGFMHVALYSWDKKTKPSHYKSSDTIPLKLRVATVRLLHISIKLIGNLDPVFRKACLVGATPLDENDRLLKNQTAFFKFLISRIATESKFSDSVKDLEAALKKNEDPFEHVRWMKHFTAEGEEIEREAEDSRYMFDFLIQNRDMAEAVFLEVKSKFCDEVEFEDVEQPYRLLLEKYRKVRRQYTNGMLSLHSALHNEHEITLS